MRYATELDWALPALARRVVECNDGAIEQWMKMRWPELKGAGRQNSLMSFEDDRVLRC
jgi:hypothetical protein